MKKVLSVLVILVLLYFGLCAILPADYEVSRSTTVNAPIEVVFDQVDQLKDWSPWSPWEKKDSTMEINYSGAESGVGQISEWTSENSGSGKQEIIELEENKLIRSSLDFGDQGMATGTWKFEEVEEGTKVTWSISGDMPFASRPFGLMMDKWIGPDFESGLADLKAHAESMPAHTYDIKVENLSGFTYISILDSCSAEDISLKLAELYGELMTHLANSDAEMAGMPMAFYHHFDYETAVVEAAVPISGTCKEVGRIKMPEMNDFDAVTTIHKGDYNNLGAGHEAVEAYVQENGVNIETYAIEFYLNDPEEVGLENAETRIAYPISTEG